MRYAAFTLALALTACSDEGANLEPTSSSAEIEAEANSIEQAAAKAAALVEADANAEITAQEISEQKDAQSAPALEKTASDGQ
ncbi:hypothetical protein ACFOWX_06440 [Sphingorhabdus arenilitoris]|uniref:Secreted protein n=1 Tax=Sphingorhabdus arenilitoris TaxID=1490041 RepID=A0ABV8RHB3_9SPHN